MLYYMGEPFCPLAQSDVAVWFLYKMAGCTGSEFFIIVVGIPCLKVIWNKCTCIIHEAFSTVILCRIQLIFYPSP